MTKIISLKKIFQDIQDWKNEHEESDPFYNNHGRALIQKGIVENHVPGLMIDLRKRTHGFDFVYELEVPEWHTRPEWGTIKIINNHGESKTVWYDRKGMWLKSLGRVCYDKQNDEIRRKNLYEDDSLLYTAMRRNGDNVLTLWVRDMEGMKKIHPIIQEHQDNKIKQIEDCQQKKQRIPRDDIQIPITDIINVLDDEDMLLICEKEIISKEQFFTRFKNKSKKVSENETI